MNAAPQQKERRMYDQQIGELKTCLDSGLRDVHKRIDNLSTSIHGEVSTTIRDMRKNLLAIFGIGCTVLSIVLTIVMAWFWNVADTWQSQNAVLIQAVHQTQRENAVLISEMKNVKEDIRGLKNGDR